MAADNLDHDMEDLENYASDASENDDIIDDDQELLALLRGEHVALRDHAPPSSTGISHHAATTIQNLSQKRATLSEPASGGEQQQRQQKRRRTQLEPSSLKSLSGTVDRLTDATGLDRHAPMSPTFLGAPIAADTIPATSPPALQDPDLTLLKRIAALSTEDSAELDETTAPSISHEDNVALTDMIRTQATRSLAINRIYQDLIVKHLQEVSIARARNREFHVGAITAYDCHSSVYNTGNNLYLHCIHNRRPSCRTLFRRRKWGNRHQWFCPHLPK